MPDEIAELFPELKQTLAAFDQDGFASNGEGAVTDESLRAWVNQRMGTRAPLAPLSTSGGGTTPTGGAIQFRAGTGGAGPANWSVEDQGAGVGEVPAPGGDDDLPPEEDDDESLPGPDDTPPEFPVTEPGELPVDDGTVLVNGERVPIARIQEYEAFNAYMARDPQLAGVIAAYFRSKMPGQAPVPPTAPAAPTPYNPTPGAPPGPPAVAAVPEGLDLDDPAIAALWQELQTTKQQQAQQAMGMQQLYRGQVERNQSENVSFVNRACESFRAQHNLSEEEITRIRKTAGALGVMPALLSGIDPITQAPCPPDPLAAIDRSLEIAMYSIPEYRAKAVAAATRTHRERAQKRQRLAGVGGSSGSVPRTSPAPASGDWRSQAVADLTRMMAE